MSSYTVEQLENEGPRYAMAMLLKCIKEGEPFVTYGAICRELEYQLNINKIFSVHIGSVAGALMDSILEIDPEAPLINALVTRPSGLPGKGVGPYFADKYNNNKYKKWNKLAKNEQTKKVSNEREKIFRYEKWDKINKKLFGGNVASRLKSKNFTEKDGTTPSGGRGGGPESEEHKKLKAWVAKHPRHIGLRKSFVEGDVESRMLSGDIVDVLFSDGNEFVTVEVKSTRSSIDDLERGVYQCVKYKAVKDAEHHPFSIKVRAFLVTEQDLPQKLKTRAKQLGVIWKRVSVN